MGWTVAVWINECWNKYIRMHSINVWGPPIRSEGGGFALSASGGKHTHWPEHPLMRAALHIVLVLFLYLKNTSVLTDDDVDYDDDFNR